ncbi:MAG: oxidoreductase, partial [Pseudolysinimonas sp.]
MRRAWVLPALAGVGAVAFGLGVAELVAGLLAPRASPVLVVGSLLIDLAPPWAKDAAIALFGTADKAALLVGIGLVLVALAGAAGVLHARRPLLARLLIVAGGAFGIVAAVTRAGASVFDAIPATVAVVAATLVLTALLKQRPAPEPREGDLSRRRFLTWAG